MSNAATTTETTTLTENTDAYKAANYNVRDFPAKVNGRPGRFSFWPEGGSQRDGRADITWSPAIVVLTARDESDRIAEEQARTAVKVGDEVTVAGVTFTVPADCARHVSGVVCWIESA